MNTKHIVITILAFISLAILIPFTFKRINKGRFVIYLDSAGILILLTGVLLGYDLFDTKTNIGNNISTL
jgi:hypothetical protein